MTCLQQNQHFAKVFLLAGIFSSITANDVSVNISNIHKANSSLQHLTTTTASTTSNRGMAMDWPSQCHISSAEPYTHNKVKEILASGTKLLEYHMEFAGYEYNPLRSNTTWSYQQDRWARVSNLHGQTLLSLAFNYGVMSMMTLTFGVEVMHVSLVDNPQHCFQKLDEDVKVKTLLHLLMRDFKDSGWITLTGSERVCHEVIAEENGLAHFQDRCCFIDQVNGEVACTTSHRNIWLTTLYILMAVVRYTVLFCGPLFFIGMVMDMARERVPYVVKLKEPLKKKLFLARADTPVDVTPKHVLDLRKQKGFHRLRESATNMPLGQIIDVDITQYDILVDYHRLLPENMVPVGIIHSLTRAIFHCKLKNTRPCKPCCNANMMQPYGSSTPVSWIDLWSRVGRALLLLIAPTPLYIRIAIYYGFEHSEVVQRKVAVNKMGLSETFENSLMHYLSPTHSLFIMIYIVCSVAAVVLAYFATSERGSYFKQMIVASFKDLKKITWLRALEMTVENFLWPFKRFGLRGCAVAFLYMPIAALISLAGWMLYSLPTIYVTFRLLYHARVGAIDSHKRRKTQYQMEKNPDNSIDHFHVENLLKKISPDDSGNTKEWKKDVYSALQRKRAQRSQSVIENKQKVLEHTMAAVLLISAMYGGLILLSECLGMLVEVLIFTLMGIILNAGTMLKFISLIFLVIIYSYDCYSNVNKRYLKLNKSLFGEIKDRIKDLQNVTSLPSSLQENFGFKSVENSEQKEHESPDDLAKDAARHWMINDLILFIDNEDMPRIPKPLFDEVCEIRVAGSPGPVHASLLRATNEFLKIVCFLFFVFLIVLSFGEVYQVSATNQSLATMAGGFLPIILRSFMQPKKPDIEIGTLSFKSKLDEIIQNFHQNWPIFDFPFQEPEEEEEEEEEEEKNDDDGGGQDNKERTKDDQWNMKSYSHDKLKKHKDKVRCKSDKKDKNFKYRSSGDGGDGDCGKRKVGKSEAHNENEGADSVQIPEYDVDIVVHLPDVTLDWWLDEWSDVDDFDHSALPMKPCDNNTMQNMV